MCVRCECGRWGRVRCARVVCLCWLSCDRRWVWFVVVQTDGATPLYVASKNGHVEAVRALLDAGAAVNQASVSGYGRAEERGMVVCVRGARLMYEWD